MKRILFLSALAGLLMLDAQAQTPAAPTPQAKVTIKGVKLREVETPQFRADNVGERSWRPKKWLEVDTEFDVRLPAAAGGRNGSLEAVVINVYVAFNHKTPEGKYEYMKGSFTCVDVPGSDKSHLLAYVAPATLRRILGKDTFSSSSDVQGWGVEVLLDNTVVERSSSTGNSAWWESDKLAPVEGAGLSSKKDSPFALLWGDYDVSVRKQ